jgi:trimeric autotransporter adhesin
MRNTRLCILLLLAVFILFISACDKNRTGWVQASTDPTRALVSLAVSPANPSIAFGTTQQFIATGTFSDNTTQDLTASVTWNSSDPTEATISSTGLATAVNNSGSTTITATDPATGINGTTKLTVTAATLVSIAVTPINSVVPCNGGLQQFTATGTFSDNTTQDLTASVTWNSSDASAVIFGGGTPGLATATAPSDVPGVTITATDPATGVNGSTMIDVKTLVSIQITSAGGATTVSAGSTLQFTAIGTFDDASMVDLTAGYNVWTSSHASWASIDSNTGLATGISVGHNVNIRANYAGVSSNTINLTIVF